MNTTEMNNQETNEVLELMSRAKRLTIALNRVSKTYIFVGIIMVLSSIFSLYRSYQASIAQDHAEKALDRYEQGVKKVDELIILMQERNKMLAKQDSILAAHGEEN